MIPYTDLNLYEINILSITLRLFLAIVFGGIIGLERGRNKHQAGFRTHILVCVGAAMAMLTNQYIYEYISPMSDPARFGAQVISGVGFLGVGTILVTGRHKIKGLTTAAGLWASACIGLALGIGFYAGALIAAVGVFIALAVLPVVERYFYTRSRVMDIYVEISSIRQVSNLLFYIRSQGAVIYDTHVSRENPTCPGGIGVHISLRLPKNISQLEIIEGLSEQNDVYLVEEI